MSAMTVGSLGVDHTPYLTTLQQQFAISVLAIELPNLVKINNVNNSLRTDLTRPVLFGINFQMQQSNIIYYSPTSLVPGF